MAAVEAWFGVLTGLLMFFAGIVASVGSRWLIKRPMPENQALPALLDQLTMLILMCGTGLAMLLLYLPPIGIPSIEGSIQTWGLFMIGILEITFASGMWVTYHIPGLVTIPSRYSLGRWFIPLLVYGSGLIWLIVSILKK